MRGQHVPSFMMESASFLHRTLGAREEPLLPRRIFDGHGKLLPETRGPGNGGLRGGSYRLGALYTENKAA